MRRLVSLPQAISRSLLYLASKSIMAKSISMLLFAITLVLSSLSLTSSIPSTTLFSAGEILSNADYLSMSLTLSLAAPQTQFSTLPSATIFAPPNSAFARFGQPPLSLIKYHISPRAFSFDSLKSLPPGTTLPTLSPAHSLVVTTQDSFSEVSLNDVKIIGSPLFDDGNLIIFGVKDFFNPNFTAVSIDRSDFECPENRDMYSFEEASGVLTSRGYSVLATFLDLQLLGFKDETRLTIFAPIDRAIAEHARGNFTNTASLFLKHVVPCKMFWSDLLNLDDGARLRTYSEGFSINVTKSADGDSLMLNSVPVHFPDIYHNDWIVVHGIDDIVKIPEGRGNVVAESGAKENERMARTRGEF